MKITTDKKGKSSRLSAVKQWFANISEDAKVAWFNKYLRIEHEPYLNHGNKQQMNKFYNWLLKQD